MPLTPAQANGGNPNGYGTFGNPGQAPPQWDPSKNAYVDPSSGAVLSQSQAAGLGLGFGQVAPQTSYGVSADAGRGPNGAQPSFSNGGVPAGSGLGGTPYNDTNLGQPLSSQMPQFVDNNNSLNMAAAVHANDPASQINRAQLQPALGNAAASRTSQVQSLGLLGNAAAGNAPSAAQIQMQQGLGQAQQQGLSMANSARGGIAAQMAAQRAGQQGNAALGQQAVNQGAQLRAGEMAQARSDFAGAATNLRSTDNSQLSTMGQLGAQDASLGLGGQQLDAGIRQNTVANNEGNIALNAQTGLGERGLDQSYQLGDRSQQLQDRQIGLSAGQTEVGNAGAVVKMGGSLIGSIAGM